jgi:methyl-accepting chemotaxis protein
MSRNISIRARILALAVLLMVLSAVIATAGWYSTIQAIVAETDQTTPMIHSSAAAVEEQQATITQIDSSVSQLRAIATSNSPAAEEITATMVQLSQLLANETKTRLAQFETA